MKSFYSYMKQYRNMDCPAGDLCRDMERDNGFPKRETQRWKILRYLTSTMVHACPEAVEEFETRWLEYAHDENINITALDCKRYLDSVIEKMKDIDGGDEWRELNDAVEELEKISEYLDEAV